MRLCLTINLLAANAAGRFKGARAGSFSNTSWLIVLVEGLLGGGRIAHLLRVHQSQRELVARTLGQSDFSTGNQRLRIGVGFRCCQSAHPDLKPCAAGFGYAQLLNGKTERLSTAILGATALHWLGEEHSAGAW